MTTFVNDGTSGDTGVLFDQIPLLLGNELFSMYPHIDPFFLMMATSEQVIRNPNSMSRNFIVRMPRKHGNTGVVEMDSQGVVHGAAVNEIGGALANANATQYKHDLSTIPGAPDPSVGPFPKPYNILLPLQGCRASAIWPFIEDDVNQLSATIGDNMAAWVQGFARQIATYRIIHFYTGGTDGRISQFTFNTSDETYSDPNGTVAITLDEDNINALQDGMIVDVYEGSVQKNLDGNDVAVPMYVTDVDHFSGVAYVSYRVAASDLAAGSGGMLEREGAANGETLTLHLRSSRNDTWPGLNSFCKARSITNPAHPNYYNPANGFFGINLIDHSQEGSFVVDAQGGPLTEQFLSSVITRFIEHRRILGMGLDSVLMRPGAYTAYIKSMSARERHDRAVGSAMEQRSAENQGYTGKFTLIVDGMRMEGYKSSYLTKGSTFILKRGDNNFKRYCPPTSSPDSAIGSLPEAAGVDPEVQRMLNATEIEPLGRKYGFHSERIPITRGGLPIEASMLSVRSRMTVAPKQFSMVKIQNVAEDKILPVTTVTQTL